jgi:hypothetical protein
MEIGFRDNRCLQYGPMDCTLDHNRRLPIVQKVESRDDIKLLHFQFVLFERMLSKQRWYRALEAVEHGVKRAQKINLYYCITRDERFVHLDPIKTEWMDGWREMGVDLEYFEESSIYWYDVEVLRFFNEKGVAYFAPIDLWDVDWEEKRNIARVEGYEEIPEFPIVDPRSIEQRLYHAYLHRFFRIPPWRNPYDLVNIPHRWVLAAARSIGLRRRHFERFGLIKPNGPMNQHSPDVSRQDY